MKNGIVFLGTGGGRYVTSKQIRNTAGFYIELGDFDYRLYVDPGPGALYHARKLKIPLEKVDLLFVSHRHLDHYNDGEAIIEAMTFGGNTKRGMLVGPKSIFDEGDRAISKYHEGLVKEIKVVKEGDVIELKKGLNIKITKTRHTEEFGVGFVLNIRGLKISYTSDGRLDKDVIKYHKDSDVVIMNCLLFSSLYKEMKKNRDYDEYSKNITPEKLKGLMFKHMDVEQVKEFLKDHKKVKIGFLRHMGWPLLKYGDSVIAKEIEEYSKVKTIALRDFDVFDIDKMELIRKERKVKTLKDI